MKDTPHPPEFSVKPRGIVASILVLICVLFSYHDTYSQKKGRSNKISFDASSTDPGSAVEPSDQTKTTRSTKTKQKQKSPFKKSNSRATSSAQQATRFTPLDRDYDYAKPPYFGHKRPVVIRPPGQQKLCRVCGIKH